MDEEEEWPETWDRNKVYMYTDPDGNKVPVPHGFTVSGAESEKYVNHNVEKRGILEELTWSSGGDYPWVQNDAGIWQSGNYHVANSTSELISDEFTVGTDGAYLSIEWRVSSHQNSDMEDVLMITITNTITGTTETPYAIRGTALGSAYANYSIELAEGIYNISIKYKKDSKNDAGSDRGYVKIGTILNYNNDGTDKVTVHKYGGLVIYEGEGEITNSNSWEESKNRNQFVWIPIKNPSRVYVTDAKTHKKMANLSPNSINSIYRAEPGLSSASGIMGSIESFSFLVNRNSSTYTKDIFYKEFQNDFDMTMASIEKYNGFYIGRYETGNLHGEKQIIQRLATDIGGKGYYEMYPKLKNITQNSNVQTCIIWGCLWNETLQWLVDTKCKTENEINIDSKEWGNYYKSTFLYSSNEGIKTKLAGSTLVPTGSSERNVANNIYDLAGNAEEFTNEQDDRRLRTTYTPRRFCI